MLIGGLRRPNAELEIKRTSITRLKHRCEGLCPNVMEVDLKSKEPRLRD